MNDRFARQKTLAKILTMTELRTFLPFVALARSGGVPKRLEVPMVENVPQELLEAGRGYENMFVPALFAAWPPHLITGAMVREGAHVLDVACGTGVLARQAYSKVGCKGRVVGADPAPGMLAAAGEVEPGIEWILCGAEALELEDASFDCVISQFGMMFFQDRPKSIREMFRVLKPGGKLAIAVWDSVERNPAYMGVISVLQEEVGTAAADALRMPFSLGESDIVKEELEAGGFVDVQVETKAETACFPSSRAMLEADLRGWLPLFDINLSEEKIGAVLVASDTTLLKYCGPSGEAMFPTSAHIFTAGKPL